MRRVLVADVMTSNEFDECPSYMAINVPVDADSGRDLARAMDGVANLCAYAEGQTLYHAEFSAHGFVCVEWLRSGAIPDGIAESRGYDFIQDDDIERGASGDYEFENVCGDVELECIRFDPDFRGSVQFRGNVRHTGIEFYTSWINLDALLLGEDDVE